MSEDNYGLKIFIIILTIAFIALAGFAVFNQKKLNNIEAAEHDAEVFYNGSIAGYQQAVLTLGRDAFKCEPVPLTIGNNTINLIAIECLQQQNQK